MLDIHSSLHEAKDSKSCEECQINLDYKTRVAAKKTELDVTILPHQVRDELQEDLRKQWVSWSDSGAGSNASTRVHNKTVNLWKFIKEHVNEEVTPAALAEAVDASIKTIYEFIKENFLWFKKINRGVWLIVDDAGNRTAAKAVRSPGRTTASASQPASPTMTAQTVSAVLAAINGVDLPAQKIQRGVGLP